MKKNNTAKSWTQLVLMVIASTALLSVAVSCKSTQVTSGPVDSSVGDTDTSSPDTGEVVDEDLPPLEIFFIDREELPADDGTPGTSYTATVYVLDNENNTLYGPFRGSTYPNTRENPEGSDKPNRVKEGPHYFNNRNGHKGQTVRGLNLIDSVDVRIVPGWSWTLQPSVVQYANVHTGFSDRGNYNSRGSQGCLTLHPDENDDFMDIFDFSLPNYQSPPKYTLGTSEGVVYVFREEEAIRNQLINELESLDE